MVRTSVIAPEIAAAAIAGLARWVRARGPCRTVKLRLEVDTERWPGATTSPFAARHIEQPGSRHSKPASVNNLSSPSATASRLTVSDPGTTQARTPSATLQPRTTAAAARRSLNRLFVHDPIKTQSTGVPIIGASGVKPHIVNCRFDRGAMCRIGNLLRIWNSTVYADDMFRADAPGHLRDDLLDVKSDSRSNTASVSLASSPGRDGTFPYCPPGA